jgi:hypothetical protein
MFNFLMGNFPQPDANILQKVRKCSREKENLALPSQPRGQARNDSLLKLKNCLGIDLFMKVHGTCNVSSDRKYLT